MKNSDSVEMKIHLDDERRTPDGWLRVYWPDEAIEILKSGEVNDAASNHSNVLLLIAVAATCCH